MHRRHRSYFVWWKIMVSIGSNSAWPPLPEAQQHEMDGAILMLQEAFDQVRVANSTHLDGLSVER
jgi:hypothetical protein